MATTGQHEPVAYSRTMTDKRRRAHGDRMPRRALYQHQARSGCLNLRLQSRYDAVMPQPQVRNLCTGRSPRNADRTLLLDIRRDRIFLGSGERESG